MDIFTTCLTYCLLTEKTFISTSLNDHNLVNGVISVVNYDDLSSHNQQLIIAQAPFLNQKGKKVIPRDEAEVNPDFLKFRQELGQALQKKDLDFVVSHLDENVKLTFGGREGKKDFLKIWNLEKNPEKSKMWQTFLNVIDLGGRFSDQERNSFVAPYTFLAEEVEDSYQNLIVIGENVTVRKTPSTKGAILGFLSYDVVKRVYESNPPQETINGETFSWMKIETKEGVVDYVYGKYIRSPIDYRVNFVNKDGTWKINLFIAGD